MRKGRGFADKALDNRTKIVYNKSMCQNYAILDFRRAEANFFIDIFGTENENKEEVKRCSYLMMLMKNET